jgi:hypothetical protein
VVVVGTGVGFVVVVASALHCKLTKFTEKPSAHSAHFLSLPAKQRAQLSTSQMSLYSAQVPSDINGCSA